MNRIIVGLDGTDRDHEILDWVGDFAYDTGVHVIAAHFVSRSVLWMIAGAQIDSANYLQQLRDHFDGDLLAPLRARIGSAHVHVQIGDPAHELAALARRTAADLIAIGAPAHTAVHDIVFGSLERRLVHESTVPLLTIPCGTRHLRPVLPTARRPPTRPPVLTAVSPRVGRTWSARNVARWRPNTAPVAPRAWYPSPARAMMLRRDAAHPVM